MHTYVHRSFRCLCPNKLHRTSWWNLCRRGLAGCKLRDYPVDGRWTLTTRADFRCHGRTWQVGPKVESRFGLLRFFEIPCLKKMILSFFLSKNFFETSFLWISPTISENLKAIFFLIGDFWWFFVSPKSLKFWAPGHPQLVGKCLGYFRVLRWGGRLCNLKVDVGWIEQAANL